MVSISDISFLVYPTCWWNGGGIAQIKTAKPKVSQASISGNGMTSGVDTGSVLIPRFGDAITNTHALSTVMYLGISR